MKVLVTGGTGFIGSHLIELLLDKGEEVFALVRDVKNLKWLKGLNIQPLEGDLFSIPPLPSGIDCVFHLAGITKAIHKADYYTVNQRGTASLFQSLESQNASPQRIIHLSSLAAAGPCINESPIHEMDPPHPITPYGKSKLLGEAEALKFKDSFPLVIIRVAAVFGPRDIDNLHYFKWIKKGILPSIALKPMILSLCYVKDLAKALYLCCQKELESGEVFNIANPEPYDYDELGKAAGKALRKRLRRMSLPIPIIFLAALISELAGKISKTPTIFDRQKFRDIKQVHWVANIQKAADKLCYSPRYTLEDAVEETMNWYLENNWL